ncbi:hypothetical protein Ancab_009165 [Ancistrocladus abbreviatus]
MSEQLERYQKLELRDSLSLSYRYPFVCRELSLILRLAYSKVPKTLQALILEDTLTAFRLLPQMQTQSAVSAANVLVQSAEAAMPKQKRALVLTEFRQAKVAHKRRSRGCKEDKGPCQLPQDVLTHIFSFLDLQSLVSAGSVCRSWNASASDNYLWQILYETYFGDSDSSTNTKVRIGGKPVNDREHAPSENVALSGSFNWKDAFRRAYIGTPLRRFRFGRAYCGYCNSIAWQSDDLTCPNIHPGMGSLGLVIKPILSPNQVVTYILEDSYLMIYSSDSDSDSDGESGFRLWRVSTMLDDRTSRC